MKTTPEGLTHLVNMLVDVVNLQRKAQGTPTACCEVELTLDEEEHRVSVHLFAEVNVAASLEEPKWRSETLSADNNQNSSESSRVTDRQAVIEVLDELGLTHFGSRPDRGSNGEPASG